MLNDGMKERMRINYQEINRSNLNALTFASLVATVLNALLIVTSFIVKDIEKNRLLYGEILLILGVVTVLSVTLCKRYKQMILPMIYVYLGVTFYLVALLGTRYTPNGYAVSFCVIFFTLPHLFIDKVYRMTTFQGVAVICFLFLTFSSKSRHIASIDMVNIICFYVISIPLNYNIMKTKVNEIDNHRLVIYRSERDGLTQVYNKSTAQKIIQEKMNLPQNQGALMIIDIDRFKSINDDFGHQIGDEAIQHVSESITNMIRPSDVVGRFGGDEFVIYLMNIQTMENAIAKAEQIRSRVIDSTKESFQNESIPITISIGIAIYPSHGISYDELLRNADAALYTAKENGKNRAYIYQT